MLDIHEEMHTHTHTSTEYIQLLANTHKDTHTEIHQRHADETLKGKKSPFMREKRLKKKTPVKCRKSPESTTTSELHTCQGESLAVGGMCQSEAPV